MAFINESRLENIDFERNTLRAEPRESLAAWTVGPRVSAYSVTSGGGMGECLRKVISFSNLVMYCCKMGKTLLVYSKYLESGF